MEKSALRVDSDAFFCRSQATALVFVGCFGGRKEVAGGGRRDDSV